MLFSLECEISLICEKLGSLQTHNWAGIHPKKPIRDNTPLPQTVFP